MKGLKMQHYDDVDDIILEALVEVCGLTDIMSRVADYDENIDNMVFEEAISESLNKVCGITDIKRGIENLERDVEYVCGTINVVKLGDKPNSLKHRYSNGIWSEDVVQVGTNYMDAVYYRVDQIQALVDKHLTRKHYCNDFLELD